MPRLWLAVSLPTFACPQAQFCGDGTVWVTLISAINLLSSCPWLCESRPPSRKWHILQVVIDPDRISSCANLWG